LKQHKIKFDWELGPPGAGVNFSIHRNAANFFGIGINTLYITWFFAPRYIHKESEAYTWDYFNSKFFFRNMINRYITIEYSLKYSYSHLGCFYCHPKNHQFIGLQIAPIFGKGFGKYKPTMVFTRSIENPTFFIYIMPLVFNFNL